MRILCTFPGKVGDIIWSLPTVRAISRFYSTPVEFACSRGFGKNGLDTLLKSQDYIADMFEIPFPSWEASGACGDNYCIPPEEKKYSHQTHSFTLGLIFILLTKVFSFPTNLNP